MKKLVRDFFYLNVDLYPRAIYFDVGFGWPALIVLALLAWWRI